MATRRMVRAILGLVLAMWATTASAQGILDAVKANDLEQVKAMVARDPSLLRAADGVGNTALHAAAIAGSVPMVEWLLANGAVIDAANAENLTPLSSAIVNSKDEVARLLVERGAGIELALHRAARRNRTAVMEVLLARGADIEARDPNGYTPLSFITRGAGPFEALDLLVRRGANINVRDSLGATPLDNAVNYPTADNRTVDLLMARSAEVDTAPVSLRQKLSAAARRGHLALFDYYLARGGEALLADEANRRPIMRNAIIGGSLSLVKKLQSLGITLTLSEDARGLTPLHAVAARAGASEMIEFLVRNGADVNARTKDGRSAYNIAEAAGNRDAMPLLLTLGASPEPQRFPRLTGPYLGQAPPGAEPELFAPGIVTVDHGTTVVSPDGQELYWPTGTSIMTMRIQDGRWTQPTYAPFSGPHDISFYDDVPFVTPDNRRLFFTSKRPIGSGGSLKENIWFVERTATGWSEPRPVSAAVNGMSLHWQVSVSRAGTLYFAGGRGGDIYCSRLADGEYTTPVALGPAVNSADGESQPFVAPDESYLLFYRVVRQIPTLHVSVKGRDGQWLPAVKANLPWVGGGLFVSPDGKYLFAGSAWTSAAFLDDLKRQSRRP